MAFRFNYSTGKFEQLNGDTNGDGVVNGFDAITNKTTTTTGAPRTTTTSTVAPRPTTTSSMAPTTTTVPRSTTTMAPTTTSTMAPTTTSTAPPRTTTTSTVAPTTTMSPTTTVAPKSTTTLPPTTTTTTPPSTTNSTVLLKTTPVGGPPTVVPAVVPPINLGPKPYSDATIAAWAKLAQDAVDDITAAPWLLQIKNAMEANAAWEQDNRTIKFNEREQLLKDAKDAKDAAAKAAIVGKGSGVSAADAAKAAAKVAADKEKRDNEFTIGRDNRAEQFRIDAENRANARTDALAEVARLRGYDGGMAAADMLESRSGERLVAALQAVKDLYDPLEQKTTEELSQQLGQIATNFANARGQVNVAGVDFLENFAKTLAYTQVPITQFSAGQNPLMEALRQQGASTVEVQNAMDLATATSQSTSDLAKWATSQLNVTQQNMDSAAMNASRGATQTALQGLSSREPEVQANMTMKYNDLMATLMRERAAANTAANQAGYAGQDAADAMRANTVANYGTAGTPTAIVPDVVKTQEPVLSTLPADPNVPNVPTKEQNTAIQLENLNKNSGLNAQQLLDELNARRGY